MVISPVMAIYHMGAMVISRGSGGSAVAAAAYRSGERIGDERTGETHDYARRSGVDGTEIIAPNGAPDWVRDRSRLWNEAEAAEKRKDSQVAREVRVALPSELYQQQRRDLVREYVRAEFTDRGMVADVAYHGGYGDNPHAHIMLTTRTLTEQGFGQKNRDWNGKERLADWREQWADHANRALERAGRSERIDHRTLAAQRAEALQRGDIERADALDREPQIHLGKAASAMRRRGQENERTRRNDRICARNRHRTQKRSRLRRSIQALDRAIRAERIGVVVKRGFRLASKTVTGAVIRIAAIPQQRRDAAQEREQLAAAAAADLDRRLAAAAADRERREAEERAQDLAEKAALADRRADHKWWDVEAGRLDVNAVDFKGRTPLHYAAEAGRTDIADKLIELGATINCPDHDGHTPEMNAYRGGHQDLADQLRMTEFKQQQDRDAARDAVTAEARRKHQVDIDTRGQAMFEKSVRESSWKYDPRTRMAPDDKRLAEDWQQQNPRKARQIENDIHQAQRAQHKPRGIEYDR